MSRINIQGTIDNIISKSNVYTPIIEAVVNSIDAIEEAKRRNGKITITIIREKELGFDDTKPKVQSIKIEDNGIGFNQKNRNSFDTFYSAEKKKVGGKGFGRFMFLKYFNNVDIESIYRNGEGFYQRKFSFGKMYDIIVSETNEPVESKYTRTTLYLKYLKDDSSLDKGLETIARKLVERLLIFFVNEKYRCPSIILREDDGSQEILLNNYVNEKKEIQPVASIPVTLKSDTNGNIEKFEVKVFKIFYAGNQKSKISLTAHNREVTETPLHNYIPEFEDDFYEEVEREKKKVKKNYIIKAYVLGKYLNKNVSLERETFNFDKEEADKLFSFSQTDIEKEAAEVVKKLFEEDVKSRSEKKSKKIHDYVNGSAPWHKSYLSDLDLTNIPYHITEERIDAELQKVKYKQEVKTRTEINHILLSTDEEFEEKLEGIMSSITEIGKSDLAHYVGSRKVILQIFEDLLKRREDGSAQLEKELHNIIFPMGKDDSEVNYEDHNLWLLDERLVFSDYIASDRKIAKNKAPDEPDLVIFDQKKSFRSGDNEFSNPLTIFEFKRPKRTTYTEDDDPVLQIARYLKQIKQGKYETPDGVEQIKVNDNTPVYGYIVSDLTPKIHDFAEKYQLTLSPDEEGYFGYHRNYKIYIEIISYKKLLKDANLRNKIFFSKLKIE